jgi:hypothetical protein
LTTIEIVEIVFNVDGKGGEVAYGLRRGEESVLWLQAFHRGPPVIVNGQHVWSWDGNREAPTLTPSYLCEGGPFAARVHLFLVAGKIRLCPDSTVVPWESP